LKYPITGKLDIAIRLYTMGANAVRLEREQRSHEASGNALPFVAKIRQKRRSQK
jgi:hypothetical protein